VPRVGLAWASRGPRVDSVCLACASRGLCVGLAWEELTGKSGRRLTEMVGKRYSRSQLVCDSRARRTLYVLLPFWFTQHSGQALALASLQFHGVQVHIDFSPLERCVCISGPNVTVKNCATACCLSANDLSACLETTYVFLDSVERDRFATMHFETLIIQNQTFQMHTLELEEVPWRDEFSGIALVPHSCTRGRSHGHINLNRIKCATGLPLATPAASLAFDLYRAGKASARANRDILSEFEGGMF